MLIGVIVGGLIDEYSYNVCKGVESEAALNGDKCVFIPGKYIGMNFESDFKNKYGYCFNSLFSYGELSAFDGLIVEMASVTMNANDDLRRMFADRFKYIPHVFISYDKTNYSSVTIDNRAGMNDALEYMYTNGATKFAMLGGPVNSLDANERKACFDEFLTRHNLRANNNNFQPASFFLDSSKEAEQLIRDNWDADVFVCANDILARHIYGACKKFNILPGKDVSVLGFDDSNFCTTTYPSISSVRIDNSEIGREAYRLLKDELESKPRTHTVVPSKFILRDSICHREQTSGKCIIPENELLNLFKPNMYIENREHIMSLARHYYGTISKLDTVKEEDLLELLKTINPSIEEMFFSDLMPYLDWELLVNKIEIKYKSLSLRLNDEAIKQQLFGSYLIFLKKMMKYCQTTDEEKSKTSWGNIYEMEAFFRDSLQFVRNNETNYARILENLDFMGIRNAGLYLYEKSYSYFQFDMFELPKTLYLKAVLKDGEPSNVPVSSQETDINAIFSNNYINPDCYEKFVMFPVFTENNLHGIIVCDMRRDGFKNAELFTNQIGSAVRMLQLRIENKTIMDEYEETLRTLKENNITLDTMSKTDPLTGLNNRRGYFIRCDSLFRLLPNADCSILIGYADMNDLKIVNDRFGHDDGDYSLRTIGSILTDFVTEHNGFAARIGGDEFAFTIVIGKDEDPEVHRDHIYELFQEFNSKSIKPYNVCVSIGYTIISEDTPMSVEDAMASADEMLYIEKFNKKKNVLK